MGLGEERGYAGQGSNTPSGQPLTAADLQQFEQNILAKIGGMLKEWNSQAMNKWLKSYEVKQLLNISAGTLQHLRDNGTLPFTRIGGVMYYKLVDIEQMLSAGRSASSSPAESALEALRKGGRR